MEVEDLKFMYNFHFCNAFIYLFHTLVRQTTKNLFFFFFFFTLHIFLSRYFLKTELFISDTFLRRINIIQHSFQRHLHAKVTFFVFFSHTLCKVSACFQIHDFFLHVCSQLFDFLRVSTGKAMDTRIFGTWEKERTLERGYINLLGS